MPGLAYTSKGYKRSNDDEEITLKLNYLEIPVLISVPVMGQPGSRTIHLFGGPNIALEAGCTLEFEDEFGSGSNDCGDDDDRRKLDLGVIAGAGVRFPAGDRFLGFVNAGANIGFVNIDEDEGDTLKNQAFFVSVGLVIPMGG